MIKRLSQGVITVVLCLGFVLFVSHAEEEKERIRIAILPCSDVVMTFKKFHPMMAYLREKTGFDIKTVVPKNFAEFEKAIKNRELDFALQDPHTYARIASLYNKDSLIMALNREGSAVQYGVVIVRRDGNIKKLEGLKGKTVMFGPELSATKWTAAKELFEKSGIDLDKDLKAYSHGGCCEDIAFQVYLRAVDAGIVCDHFLAEHPEKQKELGFDADKLIVLCKTEAVPTRVFAARKCISAGMVRTVNQALLRLDKNIPEHTKILYNAEVGGFQKSRDQDYDGIRMLIDARHID